MAMPRLPFFIINTKRPGFVFIDMGKDTDFKKLLDTPTRDLPEVPRTAMQNPYLHHKEEMLIERYRDERGREQKRFKEGVKIAEADDQGRVLIPADKPELARKILDDVRVLDPTVVLDPIGAMLPEEIPEDERKPINKGGRPRKMGPSVFDRY